MEARELPDMNKASVEDFSSKAQAPVFKVKFALKALAFTSSVITLSWFFEGWREINKAVTFSSAGVLTVGIVGTILLLGLMTFWTYCEEKQKGTLVRKVALFESLYEQVMKRNAADTRGIEEA